MKTEGPGSSRVLVTGATGFVGSAVVAACSAEGLSVRAAGYRESPFSAGLSENIFIDLADPSSLMAACRDVDAVIHCAGLAHGFLKRPSRERLWSVNVVGTSNLLQAAIKAGVRHVVLISSASVYGPGIGSRDETEPCRPDGSYGKAKLEAERQGERHAREGGMPLTILRLATAYGEGDPGNVARLIRAIDRGRFVWIGSGQNRKSLLYRGDAARACVAALGGVPRDVAIYNVSGSSPSMREIVGTIAGALGMNVPKWRLPLPLLQGLAFGRAKEILQKWGRDDLYDSRRIRSELGFEAEVSLSEGIRREVAWYRGATSASIR